MKRTLLASVLALLAAWWVVVTWQDDRQRSAQDHYLLLEMNLAEGREFRQQQRALAGTIDLGTGLLMQVMEQGAGPRPGHDDWLQLHYRGQHIDGRIFDDTFRLGQPVSIPLHETIAAWQQVLPSVPVGSTVRLIVPPELAYGESGGGPVGPGETLVFEIELLGIAAPPESRERAPDQQPVPGL